MKSWLSLGLLAVFIHSSLESCLNPPPNSCIESLGLSLIDYVMKTNACSCEKENSAPSFIYSQTTSNSQDKLNLVAFYSSSANVIKTIAKLKNQCVVMDYDRIHEGILYYLKSAENMVGLTTSVLNAAKKQEVISLVRIDSSKSPFADTHADFLKISTLNDYKLFHIEVSAFRYFDALKHVLAIAKNNHILVSLDLRNADLVKSHKDEILNILPKYVDLVFASEAESLELTNLPPQEACDFLASFCNAAVITMGKKGSWSKSHQMKFYTPNDHTKPLFTMDYFLSGFLYAYLENKTLQVCMRLGNYLASQAIESSSSELPDTMKKEIQAIFKKSKPQGPVFRAK